MERGVYGLPGSATGYPNPNPRATSGGATSILNIPIIESTPTAKGNQNNAGQRPVSQPMNDATRNAKPTTAVGRCCSQPVNCSRNFSRQSTDRCIP